MITVVQPATLGAQGVVRTDRPVITDPFFYLVAIPAVLLLGLSKSGFGAGFGSLAVPMMALAVSVPDAAAIFMPLLFVMDVLTLKAFRKELSWPLLRFMLPWGMLGIVVGALLFKALDQHTVAGLVGLFAWGFLAQRKLFPPHADAPPPGRSWGAVLTTTSGFTSFVSHSGGPPINAYVIPLRLAPTVFTGTLAAFFFVINLSKWLPYAWLGLLDTRNLATSAALLPFAPMGVWVGVKVARRISMVWFYRLVDWGMFLTGAKLIWDGFVAR
ncbi:MAG: sulfite exporter TauE/SafE family protein [Burkholderiaceae bacterium]|nr:sulfite exporter TauE/SafE family protein [Burkholderiaceae bacterium]